MATSASQIALQLQRLTNESTQKSFEYNAAEANTARTWQKMMSDTSHQREVADLKAAGLNPVLSSNAGAQSYTTSSASAQADSAAGPVANVWSSDISARATKAAAAQQAAATRYAAAAQLASARVAADASKYNADKAYEAKMKSNPVAVVTNAAEKFSKMSGLTEYLSSQFKKDIEVAKTMTKNDTQYLRSTELANKWTVSNLTMAGKANLTRILRNNGFDYATRYNMQVYLDAFMNGNTSAMREWNRLLAKGKKYNSYSQR